MTSYKEKHLKQTKGFVDKENQTVINYYELADLIYTSNLLFIWEKAKTLIRSRDVPLLYYDEKNQFICFVEGRNDEDLLLEVNDDNELMYLAHKVVVSPIYFERHYVVNEADASVCIDLYRLFKEFREQRKGLRKFN